MKTTKVLIAILVLMLFGNFSYSQQEAQFTQYLDNMLYYNPAYAGSRDALSISALHRQQWAGFKGAPMSTSFSLHSPLTYDNIGLGLSVLNDRVGPTNATWINADVSYTLKFKNHNGRLSFGIKGGINLLNGDIAALNKQDDSDDLLNLRYQNEIDPNFGAGIYYHSDQFFAGFAIPMILSDIKEIGNIANPQYINQRHYYLTIGGYINVNRMLKIRPSAMLKITENAPLALDLDLGFIMYDKFWIGANYRLLESAAIYIQYQISNQFKVGYAFEYSTTKIRTHNYGTHELLLSYDLIFKNRSIATPRYF